MTETIVDRADDEDGATTSRAREFPWPLGWWRTIALIVALCVITGVVVWRFDQPSDETFNAVDTGFLADMTTHHNGAIGSSFSYLGRENDSLVGHFAREIILTQNQEMLLMNGLLDQAGNPKTATDGVAMDWMGHAVPVANMPGMPTNGEIAQLKSSTGLAADDLFTRLMVRHHTAGAAMADYAAAHGENAKVKRLAAAMARVQRTEINEINARRNQLGLPGVDTSDLEQLDSHAR
jgi:uncharacterized protein (DUF305 family)